MLRTMCRSSPLLLSQQDHHSEGPGTPHYALKRTKSPAFHAYPCAPIFDFLERHPTVNEQDVMVRSVLHAPWLSLPGTVDRGRQCSLDRKAKEYLGYEDTSKDRHPFGN